MAVTLNAYLSFKDTTKQAMAFYQTVFGGTVESMTFKDMQASQDPMEDDLIMHAFLKGENGIEFMASDTPNHMEYKPGTNFSLSLSGDDAAQLTQYFEALSAGGTVTMPLAKAQWGDTFGMCVDKFGVNWLCNIRTA